MPINTDALKDSVNGHKPKAKRPNPNTEQQEQRLSELDQQSAHAISALAQTGVNTINAQVFAFDAKLTQFERSTAKVMAERLRQSQLRIQQYLVAELSEHPHQCADFAVLLDDVLEVPDLTSNFLAIAPYTAAGALPL
jgi:copper homeostasis protein CutC